MPDLGPALTLTEHPATEPGTTRATRTGNANEALLGPQLRAILACFHPGPQLILRSANPDETATVTPEDT